MYDAVSGELNAAAPARLATLDSRFCAHFEHAAREVGFAMALLEARGELDPEQPRSRQAGVRLFMKDVTMHEVGHTLGLRHNFRASTAVSQQQIADKAYAEKNGLTGSVMEYSPVNIALKGEKQGAYFTPTLGAYDYWAIEYAYKPFSRRAGRLLSWRRSPRARMIRSWRLRPTRISALRSTRWSIRVISAATRLRSSGAA